MKCPQRFPASLFPAHWLLTTYTQAVILWLTIYFLCFIYILLSNDIYNFTTSGGSLGVPGTFYSLNKEEGGGDTLTRRVSSHASSFCEGHAVQAQEQCSSVLSAEPRLTYPHKTLLPIFALASFAWLWSTSMLKVHHRESVSFQTVLKSLFCYSLKANSC